MPNPDGRLDPEYTIRPDEAADSVTLLRYREYVLHSALDDFRHRYAGTALGVLWNVLLPLVQIGIYSVVFTEVMSSRLSGPLRDTAFPLYLCAGFFPWIAFADCATGGADAFLKNASLLRKLAIPEEVFVARAALTATFGLGVSLVLLLGAVLAWGGPPRPAWLLVPVVALLLQAFGLGLGLVFSCLNVLFRDLSPFLPVLLQIWMWTTPVVYSETILPPAMRAALPWNPAWPFIDAFHRIVLAGEVPPAIGWTRMLVFASASLVLGTATVRRFRPVIRDLL